MTQPHNHSLQRILAPALEKANGDSPFKQRARALVMDHEISQFQNWPNPLAEDLRRS